MLRSVDHGTVRELRLERPPANALAPELVRALTDAVRAAPAAGAEALVLSGAPGMFSAGLDVPVLFELEREDLGRALVSFFDAIEALVASEVPVAVAITGHSPAGGAVLSLCCDWRVMAEGDFTIGLNEVRIGIPVPALVAELAVRAVGPRAGETLCVSGKLLSPAEAIEIGFVDELAPVGEVVAVARRWCEQIVEAPPQALADTRSVLRRDLIETIRTHREEDSSRLADLWFQPELRGAMRDLMARLKGE